VEDDTLRRSSILFAVFDLFEVFRMALASRSDRLFSQIEPSSVVFYLMATAANIVSAMLIDYLGIYARDSIAEAAVALSIVDFALVFFSEIMESLMVSVGKSDMGIVLQSVRSLGNVNNCHVWAASDDLNVGTFGISKAASSKSSRLTQVIAELQKLKIRDLTLQMAE
jgi:Co/Zn/Cd efflux system component